LHNLYTSSHATLFVSSFQCAKGCSSVEVCQVQSNRHIYKRTHAHTHTHTHTQNTQQCHSQLIGQLFNADGSMPTFSARSISASHNPTHTHTHLYPCHSYLIGQLFNAQGLIHALLGNILHCQHQGCVLEAIHHSCTNRERTVAGAHELCATKQSTSLAWNKGFYKHFVHSHQDEHVNPCEVRHYSQRERGRRNSCMYCTLPYSSRTPISEVICTLLHLALSFTPHIDMFALTAVIPRGF